MALENILKEAVKGGVGALPFATKCGKVARRAGWGAESGDSSMQVRTDGSAIRPALRQPATPHPAFGHLPQQAGEGIARCRSRRVARLGSEPGPTAAIP